MNKTKKNYENAKIDLLLFGRKNLMNDQNDEDNSLLNGFLFESYDLLEFDEENGGNGEIIKK